MKTSAVRIVAVVAALLCAPLAGAGVVVIAHPSVKAVALTADQVVQLYTGRATTLPDGTAVTPLDLGPEASVRAQFLDKVLHKNEQQLRSYWTRAIFTGNGHPPRAAANVAEVLRSVASTPGYIGYVDSKDVVSDKVKVLYTAE